MKLLTVGDSFTYGEELADKTLAWPNLLANKLACTVNNLARPGSGNSSMIRHAVEQIDNYDLAVIAWSHFARVEVADEQGIFDIWPGCTKEIYKSLQPWRDDLINYNNKHHDDQYLYRQYLLNIILLQNFLKNNNKRYLMLDAFGNNLHYERNIASKQLTAQIDTKHFIGWPTETMMEWVFGTSKGPRGHFLEQGHERVADKIYEHIRHRSWIS